MLCVSVSVCFVQHRGPESFVARAKLERQLIALEKEGAVMKGACILVHRHYTQLALAPFLLH